MKLISFTLIVFIMTLVSGYAQTKSKINYPVSKKIPHTDEYNGVKISDPYHWMEQLNTPELNQWMLAQEEVYDRFMADKTDLTATFKSEIAEQYEKKVTYAPIQRGNNLFVPVTAPGAMSTEIYLANPENQTKELLIDLEKMNDSIKTYRTINYSPAGKYIAISESINKSRYYKVLVYDVDNRKLLDDVIEGYYGGRSFVGWKQDDSGFYYSKYNVPDNPQMPISAGKLMFHQIGKDQKNDRLIYENNSRPSWIYRASTTYDNQWLIVQVSDPAYTGNIIFVKNLLKTSTPFTKLVVDFDYQFSFLYKHSHRLYFRTTLEAPKHRIVAIDLKDLEKPIWKEVIPASDQVITGTFVIGNRLALRSSKVTKTVLNVYSFDGTYQYQLAPDGSALFFSPTDRHSTKAYMTAASILSPVSVFEVDLATGSNSLYSQVKLSVNPADYVFEHSVYKSKDGTLVPIQLIYKKDMKKNGEAPVFLYGYGAFNWAAYPWQSYLRPWVKRGGIYAIANIRGGGVYGESWHKAGSKENKQNAIDDYISAAEWLITAGYTKKGLIVANGGSASGLMPAIAINERPDLYGAAIIDYPVTDMLRYHKFGSANWSSEFGTADDPKDFKLLRTYSPYHNIKENHCYPPVLVQVGELDNTTTPMHGYKYIAALQNALSNNCGHPMMLKIARGAGHSAGATRLDQAHTQAEQFSFIYKVMGLKATE